MQGIRVVSKSIPVVIYALLDCVILTLDIFATKYNDSPKYAESPTEGVWVIIYQSVELNPHCFFPKILQSGTVLFVNYWAIKLKSSSAVSKKM